MSGTVNSNAGVTPVDEEELTGDQLEEEEGIGESSTEELPVDSLGFPKENFQPKKAEKKTASEDETGEDEESEPEESDEEAPKKRTSSASAVKSLAEKVDKLTEQNDYLREMLIRMQTNQPIREEVPPKEDDPFEGLDPDEPITAKHFMKAVAAVEKKAERRVMESQRESKRTLISMSEELASMKYPDYENTVKLAAELARETPALIDRIALSKNPAEEAYRIGKTHPGYKAAAPKKKAQSRDRELLERAEKKIQTPRSIVSMRGQKGKYGGVKNFADMTSQEFFEYRKKHFGDI